MLGKLLKHELRATGRILLPIFGAMAVLAGLANISMEVLDGAKSWVITALGVIVIATAVLAFLATQLAPMIVMILRFHRNLLSNEGYLMHTLPVNVHSLIWSKLIASSIWLVVSNLLLAAAMGLTGMHIGHMSLAEVFRGFPSWEQIRAAMQELGMSGWDLGLILFEGVAMLLLALLGGCLHFYAAMSLGYTASKNKGLLSVVIFVGFNFLFSATGAVQPFLTPDSIERAMMSATSIFAFLQSFLGALLLMTLLQSVVYYVATFFGLKKGLNLA